MPIRIAVDAMGGDHAPAVVVEGVVQALRNEADLQIALVGPTDQVQAALAATEGATDLPIQVVEAPEVIGMAESPAAAVKSKRRSSIHVGLGMHKQGHVDGFVSAGNTGAVMAASLFILGRLPNVARPSITTLFPTTQSHCVVIDIGANVDCKPEHLVQFAQMGSIYAERILKRERPAVGLLNIGEEPGKGNEQSKAAYKLLEQAPGVHFIGNVEGRDVMQHAADVIVCDGFVGNVMLKFGESMANMLKHVFAEEIRRLALPPDQVQVVMQLLQGVRRWFDYEEEGGAPLLGVNGNVLIGHGGSTPRAISQLICTAVEVVKQDIAGSIATALEA